MKIDRRFHHRPRQGKLLSAVTCVRRRVYSESAIYFAPACPFGVYWEIAVPAIILAATRDVILALNCQQNTVIKLLKLLASAVDVSCLGTRVQLKNAAAQPKTLPNA